MVSEIAQKALDLSGGKKARVLIIPLASSRADTGFNSQQMWHALGAERVEVINGQDKAAALVAIKQADFIWMSGGNQCRLMDLLKQEGVIDAIRERFRQGATIGGTSAGAAVMSVEMLTGEISADKVGKGSARVCEGLGLWPEVIVDQHFLQRHRYNRLLGAVLTHPNKVGIGIDVSTAAIVTGRTFEVVGKSKIVVIDARHETRALSKESGPASTEAPRPLELMSGMRFDLDKGLLTAEKNATEAPTALAGKTPISNPMSKAGTPP
jgi:cyanophycinase